MKRLTGLQKDEIRHKAIQMYIENQIDPVDAWIETVLTYFKKLGYIKDAEDGDGTSQRKTLGTGDDGR